MIELWLNTACLLGIARDEPILYFVSVGPYLSTNYRLLCDAHTPAEACRTVTVILIAAAAAAAAATAAAAAVGQIVVVVWLHCAVVVYSLMTIVVSRTTRRRKRKRRRNRRHKNRPGHEPDMNSGPEVDACVGEVNTWVLNKMAAILLMTFLIVFTWKKKSYWSFTEICFLGFSWQ